MDNTFTRPTLYLLEYLWISIYELNKILGLTYFEYLKFGNGWSGIRRGLGTKKVGVVTYIVATCSYFGWNMKKVGWPNWPERWTLM